MSLSQELREGRGELWEQMVTHPFVQELGADTLPLEKFQRYFLQDYAFVRDLVKLVSLITAKAPDLETARRLTGFLNDVLAGEEGLFRDTFREWGLSPDQYLNAEPAPVTRAFGDFVIRIAYEGGFPEALTTLVTTEWTYLDWATRLVQAGKLPETSVYKAWIDIHSNADFTSFVTWLRERLDALPLEEGRRRAIGNVFSQTLQYEYQFWEMAHGG